ncbi:MFS general substrate transporter [Mycena latifolia]|nr:MFS general substrate transporter [Mycena latifolia]
MATSTNPAQLDGQTNPQSPLSDECNPLAAQNSIRKGIILFFLCLAQFLDTFMNSALVAAIPLISADLGITNADSVWLVSGYQLTFAALLLVSGRLSDLYDPKIVFSIGATLIGGLSLGAGFVRAEVPLIVLRVLTGIGAALTVPSALHLIVHMFPDTAAQAKAIAAFGASGAFGNVIGLMIGALIVTYASWPWVFYLFSILGFVLAIVVFVLAPSPDRPHISAMDKAKRFKRLDLLGVSMLTVGLVLFVYAVTSGSISGWNTAHCLAPLFISLLCVALFFIYEARLPEEMAALPPSLWAYTNVPILVTSALLPFMWWGAVQLLFSWLWQEVYGWTALNVALRFLPMGLLGFPMNALASVLQQFFPLKWILVAGQVLALIATALLPFADTEARYWSFAFPAFCIGTTGITIAFTTINIAIFVATPPRFAGVIGALFNCSLQLGCAAGTAIITSIQTSVQKTHGGPTSYSGRKAGFWFLFGVLGLLTAAQWSLMKSNVPAQKSKAVETSSVASPMNGGGNEKEEISTVLMEGNPSLALPP